MGEFMTTREAVARWDISARRINVLCKTGRIYGAYKEDNQWLIPADAVKPADKRLKADAPGGKHRPWQRKNYRCRSVFPITAEHPGNIIMWIRRC